jgi:hypothetical protein
MKKQTITTPQMKYDYSERIVLQLYMQKLITQDEFKEILVRLKQHYQVSGNPSPSNGLSPN